MTPRPLSRHPLLLLAIVLALVWRVADSLAREARRGGGWAVVAAGLLGEDDEELYRRALGDDHAPYAALRDHVPPGRRVVLVGDSPEGARFYQRVETMLYPLRFVAVPMAEMGRWRAAGPGPERDVHVLFYDEPPDGLPEAAGLVPVEAGPGVRLYVLPAGAERD